MRPLTRMVLALVLLGGCPAGAAAQDTDRLRFYFGPRIGYGVLLDGTPAPGIELSGGRQTGFVAGVSINKFFGFQASFDHVEADLKTPALGTVGEYGIFTFVPQVRARYPMLRDRLVPYITGGVGFSHNEFNDRKPPGIGVPIDANGTTFVASVGAGIEYFVANNIALGAEAQWIYSRDQHITVGDAGGQADLDSILASVNLRLFVPEGPEARPPPEAPDWRPYIGLRIGAAFIPQNEIADGWHATPQNGAIFSTGNLLFNVAAGLDIGRYFGLEFAADGFEPDLKVNGIGTIREMAIYNFLPQARLRYPLLAGRLVPYLIGGVGVSYLETNDAKPVGADIDVRSGTFSPVGVVGGGLDYFVARNIALGLEAKYIIDRGHSLTVSGQTQTVNLDSVQTSLGVRIYFR